jgi:hypothetical protein
MLKKKTYRILYPSGRLSPESGSKKEMKAMAKMLFGASVVPVETTYLKEYGNRNGKPYKDF